MELGKKGHCKQIHTTAVLEYLQTLSIYFLYYCINIT